ncbi:MAG: hypothetical protein EF807_01390 [Candidatus Methanolliviera hydrocarbonicum]|uniref:Uncharacterized protein n=1 Tax=Candidatus Methanolliviera hydrocarbonicum TaxID=2491085 RepID=A0A520KYH6_9EURY|nr:MAG: hypothetical protein EF807_01390 [Candidatus Methanolliviera hydrocarbonicum]
MNIDDLKKLDNLTLLKIGLSATEMLKKESTRKRHSSTEEDYDEIIETCYRELSKRREGEKNKFRRHIINLSYKKLMEMVREYVVDNPKVSSECYNELLWRRRLDELRGHVEIKTALQKLEEILSG